MKPIATKGQSFLEGDELLRVRRYVDAAARAADVDPEDGAAVAAVPQADQATVAEGRGEAAELDGVPQARVSLRVFQEP